MRAKAKRQQDILIVEDEPVVVEATRKALSDGGFSVDETVDAASALEKLQRCKYRVLLLDLMLPTISGLELLETVNRKYPNLPVIMITGYATRENAVRSLKLGAFDFVPKPFTFEELLGVVYRAIRFQKRLTSSGPKGDPIGQLYRQRLNDGTLIKLHFLGQHSWAKIDEDGSAIFGVGETFPGNVGEIRRIDFPPINEEVSQGNVCTRITTKEEWVHTVWAPLSGKVIERNAALERDANFINTDPFFQGWLLRVIPTNLENELANLVLR